VFAVTYLAFVIGFAIDTSNVYQGFKTDEHHLGMTSTAAAPHEWVGTLTGLRNVVSTRLVVHQSNLTAAIQKFKHLQQPPPVAVGYDVTLWACGLADGCGTAFLRPTAGARGPNNAWQQVLSLTNSVQFPVGALGAGVTLELFPTTYQNEEAIPSVGTVRSYYIAVNYTNNAWGLFTGTDAKLESSAVSYVATVLQQPANPTAVGVGYVILLFLVLAALGGFIFVMVSQKKKWLCEQKWVCWYLTAVILFINPIYCVIIWMQSAPPRPAVVFAFYVVDAMGQVRAMQFFFQSDSWTPVFHLNSRPFTSSINSFVTVCCAGHVRRCLVAVRRQHQPQAPVCDALLRAKDFRRKRHFRPFCGPNRPPISFHQPGVDGVQQAQPSVGRVQLVGGTPAVVRGSVWLLVGDHLRVGRLLVGHARPDQPETARAAVHEHPILAAQLPLLLHAVDAAGSVLCFPVRRGDLLPREAARKFR